MMPDWRGKAVAVLASGPTMSQAVADRVRHMPCIAINATYQLAPWANVLFAYDLHWWQANPQAQQFAGLRVCGQPGVGDTVLFRCPVERAEIAPGHVVEFQSSGIAAIRFAVAAGARRIELYGFGGTGHWHAGPQHDEQTLRAWAVGLTALMSELQLQGIEVINKSEEVKHVG